MSPITDFVKGKDKGAIFREKAKGKSKEEVRKLEETLLQPESIPDYTGPAPAPDAAHPVRKLTVMVVLPDMDTVDRFKRFFPVSRNHPEPSLTSNDLLLALLHELESGRIQYDAKNKTITYPGAS